MLKEALQYLMGQSSDQRKAGFRILKTPGAIPGQIHVINARDNGVYEHETIDYLLAPKKYRARTIDGFCQFIFNSVPAKDAKTWHVMIGKSEIVGYRVEGTAYEHADAITLDLTETEEYANFATMRGWKPSELKKAIERTFSKYDPIYTNLVPMIGKMSVNESKSTTQQTSKMNESLGISVQKELQLANPEAELPDEVTVHLRKYEEIDGTCMITHKVYFDFELGQIIFQPTTGSVRDAEVATNKYIIDMISKGDPKPIISQVSIIDPGYATESSLS